MYVPRDPSGFNQFINLRDRKTGNKVYFGENSVVITEKLADALEIEIGDLVVYEHSDDQVDRFVVTDIAENYVGSYLYINETDYKDAFKQDIDYNKVICMDLSFKWQKT